jgi:hypothetical protein
VRLLLSDNIFVRCNTLAASFHLAKAAGRHSRQNLRLNNLKKMSSRYTNMKVHISDNQKSKLQQAVEKGEAVSIRLSYESLQGNDVLAFTKSQLNKIADAFNNQKGVAIKMSKTQDEHNKQIEGGFILPLLGAVASAVLPSLASTVIDRIMGKGLFIKSGNGIVKVKQLGDGLYLRPYRTQNIMVDGLFIKRGGNYEPVNDLTVRDIPLLAALVGPPA